MQGADHHIVVELVQAPTPEMRSLIEELDDELSRHYPPEQRHGFKLEAIFQPHVRFFLARLGGSAVGCGGVALLPELAELKRMYVRPSARGQGVADAIIGQLEYEAREAGLPTVKLETGTSQHAAIKFYGRCGYIPCEAFEPYSSMAPESIVTSYFMEKLL